MDKRKEILQHIEFIYKNSINQVVIDLGQAAEEILNDSSEDDEADKLGALCYRIDTILEIYNPKIEKEIKFLQELYNQLSQLEEIARKQKK